MTFSVHPNSDTYEYTQASALVHNDLKVDSREIDEIQRNSAAFRVNLCVVICLTVISALAITKIITPVVFTATAVPLLAISIGVNIYSKQKFEKAFKQLSDTLTAKCVQKQHNAVPVYMEGTYGENRDNNKQAVIITAVVLIILAAVAGCSIAGYIPIKTAGWVALTPILGVSCHFIVSKCSRLFRQ